MLLTCFGSSAKQVSAELSLVVVRSCGWAAFLDAPLFFSTLQNPTERRNLQPALVLALLAVSVLQQSNEVEDGQTGRFCARMFFLSSCFR